MQGAADYNNVHHHSNSNNIHDNIVAKYDFLHFYLDNYYHVLHSKNCYSYRLDSLRRRIG